MPLRILFKDSLEGFSKDLFEELFKESSREASKDLWKEFRSPELQILLPPFYLLFLTKINKEILRLFLGSFPQDFPQTFS